MLQGVTMSNEQITREFPFLNNVLYGFRSNHWEDATLTMRVSRIHLDALTLPMADERNNNWTIERQLFFFDADGRDIFADADRLVAMGEELVGDVMLRAFLAEHGKEHADEVFYIVFTADLSTGRWRRQKGGEPYRAWHSQHFELVLYKMPKNKTLWQLLQRYRKNARALRANG